MITLGKKVRDTVTGLIGMATKRLEPVHGANQILIEWTHGEAPMTSMQERWIEEPRLELFEQSEAPAINSGNRSAGGSRGGKPKARKVA